MKKWYMTIIWFMYPPLILATLLACIYLAFQHRSSAILYGLLCVIFLATYVILLIRYYVLKKQEAMQQPGVRMKSEQP